MLNWIWSFFCGRSLEEALRETRTVRIRGVRFVLKKLDMLNYLDGSKVLMQVFDTYKAGGDPPSSASEKKMREHMAQVIVAGVVRPKLSLKTDGETVCVDELFADFEMAVEVYNQVLEFTYGKKKASQRGSQKHA